MPKKPGARRFVERLGLLTERTNPESVEKFLDIYKTDRGEWALNSSIVAAKWQPFLDTALEKEPIPATDFIYHFGEIVNYVAYGRVEIEDQKYTLLSVLERVPKASKHIAMEQYCRYIESGDAGKAEQVRIVYGLKIKEHSPCANHAEQRTLSASD